MSAQFNIKAADPALVACLQQQLGLPRFIAATLVARGIETPKAAQAFFAPSLERDWLDPYLIPGLADVADALQEAVRADRHIVVFGDFDLDGISATATLTYGLRALGAQVTPFVPLRVEEGYGLTEAAIGRLLELKPDFVVTVDCGIASKHEVALIREAGVEVAVTDHHEPVDLVPEEVPVADPKLDAACPSTALAGVGVALKLVQVLGGRFGKPHLWRDYTDLAALGTVADLMPMLSENRALVADGIARMNQAPRGCIAALLGISGVQGTALDAINLSFSLIPRLNAAGRMGDARLALDLLLSDDFAEAQALAAELEEINDRRRVIEAELSEAAKEQAVLHYQGQRVLVVSGEGWHEGVKGIVASRLVNTYAVPTLLFTIDGDVARGSGRSVGQVNLFKAVESLSDMLVRFGGHEAAVGVTVPTARLTEFAERLSAYMDGLPAESFRSHTEIDACVALDELTLKNVVQLEKLAPFGQENPTPCFLALNVTLTNCKAVGADKSHLACTLSDGKHSLASIKFHCSDIEAIMRYDTVVNAAFRLQIDEWNGRKTVKAVIESFTPPQACAALEACLDPLDLDFMEDLYTAGGSRPDASRQKAEQAEEARFAVRKKNRAFWEGQAKADPAALQAQIIAALIGDRQLHDSQAEALDCLARGQSVLAVMPTGRGKSLIFHVHAACQALLRGTTSLFVYPLRALIADQAFHIGEALEGFGIATAVLTGGMGPQKRSEAFASIAEGACDIVLATPEFLDWHADALCDAADIGFVVVDEAHHIGLAKAGQRPAYLRLGKAVARLGSPTVLASTATADREVADAIKATLGIERCVCDETVRENLAVDDQRNLKDRASYLANLVAGGEKTVVYVNSREQSVALARMLRKLVPQMASLIGFYNAGLTRAERRHVEDLFRTDALCVLVSTSAFGEGVNIPHVRHVVLYHLPFNEIEFNQMSGRAGRDGQPATVHLLFGRADAGINEQILYDMTPSHDCLAQVYRELRRLQGQSAESFFALSNAELAQAASANKRVSVPVASAACAVAVFRELGLVETRTSCESGEIKRFIHVRDAKTKVELIDSIRYCEGLGEREVFRIFCDWVMQGTKSLLKGRISKAILPGAPDA